MASSVGVASSSAFRDGFIHGEIVGAGPDVISTLWGMWWLQQEGGVLSLERKPPLLTFPMEQQGLCCLLHLL